MNRYNELMGGIEGSTIDDFSSDDQGFEQSKEQKYDSSSDDQGFDQPKEQKYDMKNFDTLMKEFTFLQNLNSSENLSTDEIVKVLTNLERLKKINNDLIRIVEKNNF
tara:strand:- start:1564 stop:1884 length:321 start_codon:yes stop_codon:yes gene_type:complete